MPAPPHRKHRFKNSYNPEKEWNNHTTSRIPEAQRYFIATAIFLSACIIGTAIYFSLSRQRAAISTATAITAVTSTDLDDPAVQASLTAQSRIALTALNTFLFTENEILRIAQIRPLPDIGKRYLAAQSQLDSLKKSKPHPGGKLLTRAPFLGIPLTLAGGESRIAWFEMNGGAARLDLDSLFALSDLPWPELPATPIGQSHLVRGYITAIHADNATFTFNSPAQDQSWIVLGTLPAAAEIELPRAATLTLTRLPESAIHRAQWKLKRLDSIDWLLAP